MKKIVSNILIVSTQLLVGGLFLLTLFSNNGANNSVVVVKNNNLDKMADSVSDLFIEDLSTSTISSDDTVEEELVTEQMIAEEQAKKEAEEQAKIEEEARLEEARIKAEAEAKAEEQAKKEVEEVPQADVPVSSVSQTVEELQSYAHDLVINSYGWTEADFTALVNLWDKESKWNPNCYNSRSGAYGIPQALPGSKMASEGSDYNTNGETQIRWGLKYIQSRYGSPSGAWQHFLDVGWY